jgi:hypothetical protein
MDLISILTLFFAFLLGYNVHRIKTIINNEIVLEKLKDEIERQSDNVVEVESERIGEMYHIRKFDTKEFLAQGPTMVAAGEAALDRLPKDSQIRIVNVIN